MTWTQDPITSSWTKAGSGREVMVSATPWPGDRAVRLRLVDRADKVAAFLPGSKLGDSGLRIGVDAADKTKLSVCPVNFYTIASPVTTGAGDTPASSPAIVALPIAADDQPFVLTVRFNKGLLEVFIDDATTPAISWAAAGQHKYAKYRHMGFESGVDGAIVARAELVTLEADAPSPQVEVLFAACQGDLFASAEGEQMARIAASSFVREGRVCLVEYQGMVFGVDSTQGREIDPQDYSVTQWTASAGTFPGSTPSVAGSTRCAEAFVDGARIGLYRDPTQPNAGFWSAINDAHDWDTANRQAPGKAYALPTDLPGLVNEPITCIYQGTRNEVLIGTISGCLRKVGDPALGPPDIHAVSRDHGVSGPTSIVMANDGLAVYHSSDGLFIVPSGGLAVNISQNVLTRYLEVPRVDLETFWIIAIRDPRRHNLHIFLTPRATGPGVHITYDERVGQYAPGQGGFFIDTYPDRCGPTAACIYQGQMVLGTRDGYLCILDDTGTADDGGEAVDMRYGLSLVAIGDQSADTQLDELRLTLGRESTDTRFEVWGGETAEQALVGPDRFLLYRGLAQADNPGKPFTQRVRAKAIVVEMLSHAAGERHAFEKAEAVITPVAPGRRRARVTPAAPSGPCAPDSSTGTSFDTGPGTVSLGIEHILSDVYRQDTYNNRLIEETYVVLAGGAGNGGMKYGQYGSAGASVEVVPF